MIRGRGRIFRIFFCILLFLAAACTVKQTPRIEGEFSNERDRLKTMTQEPSPRAQAHLERAKLYASHKNVGRDYLKACREYEAYLTLVPSEVQKEEDQDWMAVLKEMERSEGEIALLRGVVESLRAENDAGRKTLEAYRKTLDGEVKKNKEMRAAMEKTLTRVESLEKANRSLQETNRSMRESNDKMKEIINQLVKLDQELEQKRRSIK